jgi:hypothetical protein
MTNEKNITISNDVETDAETTDMPPPDGGVKTPPGPTPSPASTPPGGRAETATIKPSPLWILAPILLVALGIFLSR